MAHHPELWKTLRWLAFLAAVVGLGFLGLRAVEDTTTAGGRSLEKVLSSLTRADTRVVEGRATISERNNIAELALVELRMSATRRFENETYLLRYLPAGSKHLIARGRYRVTAGYRLEPGVSLQLEGGVPVARFPEPEILGVELLDYEILSEKDGWANNITASDRGALLRGLRAQMRREARESGVLETVESTLRTRLKDLLGSEEVRIESPEPEPSS